jgi:hypothetical protein
MAKKGILVLMMVALMVLVGCEDTPSLTMEEVLSLEREWYNGPSDEVQISLVANDTETDLDHLDVRLTLSSMYYIPVTSYNEDTIHGTYTDGDEADLPISVHLSYSAPNLTFTFTGEGFLNGKTYSLIPIPAAP